mmetsp:Transcript_79243/g.232712  ORF Transcript_79243/g.232712 Transcript_79243/m.232712 type:complete len:259 (-) Transcript_79243:525-1301(-)
MPLHLLHVLQSTARLTPGLQCPKDPRLAVQEARKALHGAVRVPQLRVGVGGQEWDQHQPSHDQRGPLQHGPSNDDPRPNEHRRRHVQRGADGHAEVQPVRSAELLRAGGGATPCCCADGLARLDLQRGHGQQRILLPTTLRVLCLVFHDVSEDLLRIKRELSLAAQRHLEASYLDPDVRGRPRHVEDSHVDAGHHCQRLEQRRGRLRRTPARRTVGEHRTQRRHHVEGDEDDALHDRIPHTAAAIQKARRPAHRVERA